MENTVIQHIFLKFDQSKKNRFSIKKQIKQKNSRSSEKISSGNTALKPTFVVKLEIARAANGRVFDRGGRSHFFRLRLLSSRCILNMQRLVTLKYKQMKTVKTNSESNLEVCR